MVRVFRDFQKRWDSNRIKIPLLWVFLAILFSGGCGYRLAISKKQILEGYQRVAIPIFKNYSQHEGLGVIFTNALRNEFASKGVLKVLPVQSSSVILKGEILDVTVLSSAKTTLPNDKTLSTEYRVGVEVKFHVLRRSDSKQLWERTFERQKVFLASQVTLNTLNTANVFYNKSQFKHTVKTLAEAMMSEVYHSLSEGF